MNSSIQRNIKAFLQSELSKIILCSIIIKVPICFMIYSYLDIPRYTEVGASLLYGLNPYSLGIFYGNIASDDIPFEYFPYFYYNKYPPLFFYIQSGWFFFFGNSIFSLWVLFLISDSLCAVVLFKIGEFLYGYEMGIKFSYIFAFIPFNVINFMMGQNDTIPVLFCLLGIFAFLKSKHNHASLYLSFGICFKLFPAFVYLSFLIYYFKSKNFKAFLASLLIFIVVLMLLSIPFLIWDANTYILSLLRNASRANDGISFKNLVPWLYSLVLIGDSQNPSYGQIRAMSIAFIIQVSILSIVSLLFIFIKEKKGIVSKKNALDWALIYMLILALLMNRGNLANFVWASPLLLIHLKNYLEKIELTSLKSSRSLLLLYFIMIGFILIEYLSHPVSVFQNYREIGETINLNQYISEVLFEECVPRPPDFIKIGIFLYTAILLKYKYPNIPILSNILFLNAFDWIFFYSEYYFGNQSPWGMIFLLYWIGRIVFFLYLYKMIWKHTNYYNRAKNERGP